MSLTLVWCCARCFGNLAQEEKTNIITDENGQAFHKKCYDEMQEIRKLPLLDLSQIKRAQERLKQMQENIRKVWEEDKEKGK